MGGTLFKIHCITKGDLTVILSWRKESCGSGLIVYWTVRSSRSQDKARGSPYSAFEEAEGGLYNVTGNSSPD